MASRIFVVDDENSITSSLVNILNRNGFSARAFTNPFEALAAAREDTPDLLISDVVMPEFSGIELAIRMKKLIPECEILLISGQAHVADLLEDARQQGHNFRLLAKPIFTREMLSEIAAIEDGQVKVESPQSQQRTSGIELCQPSTSHSTFDAIVQSIDAEINRLVKARALLTGHPSIETRQQG